MNPRILLLGGGIEFQRSECKFSSLETLIEQEEKYIEILVEKISSLKPDVLIVGKSISGKAQELLFNQNMVALQNVKARQLERISRMLDATILPTTDHIFQQKSDECIGSCQKFSIKSIQNDPERIKRSENYAGILGDRAYKGSSYIFLGGCPPILGCSVILRGECRAILSQIKRILKFCVIVAYHLKLEVAYYNDRYAIIPGDLYGEKDNCDTVEWSDTDFFHERTREFMLRSRKSIEERCLLSTSLDVDICLPYINPIHGIRLADTRECPKQSSLATEYQRISCTAIIMGDRTQKSKAELISMNFYGEADTALGRFLVDRCFRLKYKERVNLVGNTLAFVHRAGRIDFEISLKEGEHSNEVLSEGERSIVDPIKLPIYTSSYCSMCDN